MANYQQVFGGSTIYPSDVSYLAIALDADFVLEWPLNKGTTLDPASRIIDVTASAAYTITLPPADETGPGQTILFNNLSASATEFFVVDAAGGAVATVGVGTQWQVYLADNDTPAGVWRVYQMGASTASVQPGDLAGYGIVALEGQLSQATPVAEFNSTPRTAMLTDRASALVWTGTGAGLVNLPTAGTAGNDYFVSFRNAGGGALTLEPAGSETIDGLAALILNPGDSATVLTNGVAWYTLGLGQESVFAFDYTVIDMTGKTSPYALSGSELNRVAYSFIGTLTADMVVVVPSTTQQYWVANNTTGAFSLSLSTPGGIPVSVAQGSRLILYSNGANVLQANTGNIALPVSATQGGTGQTIYSVGDLLYADTTTTLAKLSDIATGNALLTGGVGVAPSYGKVGLTTHVSGVLPLANGGLGTALADPNADRIVFWDDSANATTWLTVGAGLQIVGTTLSNTGASVNVQEFTASGTWTKPANAKVVLVELWGGGGGGGSGRKGAAGGPRGGGGGGGGGSYNTRTYNASDLAASVTVAVGAGGTGGASATVNSTNGAVGGDGGVSVFAAVPSGTARSLSAYGGKGGGGGQQSDAATGGYGGSPINDLVLNDAGTVNNLEAGLGGFRAATPINNSANANGTPGSGYCGGGGGSDGPSGGAIGSGGGTNLGGGGGGAGGSVNAGNVAQAGGAGGTNEAPVGGSTATATAAAFFGGRAGNGNNSGNGQNGYNGGLVGGGGGGGAATNSVGNSGAGGNGGNGFVRVITISGT